MKRAAVVISTYNAGRYINDAIESVLNQTEKNIEIVIQDDASTDNTLELSRRFKDRRLSLYSNPINVGAVANFNLGVRRTSAPLVVKLDGDDMLLPRHVAECATRLEADQSCAFVFTQGYVRFPSGSQTTYSKWQCDRLFNEREFYLESLVNGNPCLASSVMFRRESFERVGGFASAYLRSPGYEDFLLWLRLGLMGNCHYISLPLAIYRSHGNGLLGRLAHPEHRAPLRYFCQELSEMADQVFKESWPTKEELLLIRSNLANRWLWAAGNCAFLPEHRSYCFRRSVELLQWKVVGKKHFWWMLAKLLVGRRRYESVRRLWLSHHHHLS